MAEYPNLSEPETGPDDYWKESFLELKANFGILESRIEALDFRVHTLETGRAPASDELGDKIVAFLKKFPGIKFNTGSIAANVGSSALKLSDKLKRMAERGLVQHEKLEGHSAMYWYEEKKSD
jgi:hypothetical protein